MLIVARQAPAARPPADAIGHRGDGGEPRVYLAPNEGAEVAAVTEYLLSCIADGMDKKEIAILVRSERQLDRAQAAARAAGLIKNESTVLVATMHAAKGLEFRAVAVMACDDDVIPDGLRIASIGDMAEFEATYDSERHLLYVACTRARDRLFVSGIQPGSEFLEDIERRRK